MGTEWAWLPALALACGGNVTAQVMLVRAIPSLGVFRSMLGGFLLGAAIVAVALSLMDRTLDRQLASVGIYGCFAYVYFHLNQMGETARRVRLVIELAGAGGSLTRAELLARYGAREIVERRIGRLLASRQIVARGDRYALGDATVLRMARIVERFKRLLGVAGLP